MNHESKKRLARSIRKVLSNLDSDAKCFCFTNEPEFKEVKAYLINTANKLDTERTIPQKRGEETIKNKVQSISKDEFEELARTSNGGAHIWVKMLDIGCASTALTDYHDNYGALAIWCAGSEADWLKAEDYGTKWVAYTSEPPEMCEEEKAPPHLNGME